MVTTIQRRAPKLGNISWRVKSTSILWKEKKIVKFREITTMQKFTLTYQNFQNTQVSKVRQPYERPLRTSREPRPSSQYWTCHLWPWESQPFQSPTRSWDHWDQSMEAQARIPIFPRYLCHQHLLKRHFDSYNFHLVLVSIFKSWNLPFFGRPRPNPLRDFREFLPPERWLCTWLPLVGNPIYQNFQLSNWYRLISKL